MSTNDGGPAFPDPGRAQSAKQRNVLTDVGMSLRDYFAAAAIHGIVANRDWDGNFADYATDAYAIADHMLAAREAK